MDRQKPSGTPAGTPAGTPTGGCQLWSQLNAAFPPEPSRGSRWSVFDKEVYRVHIIWSICTVRIRNRRPQTQTRFQTISPPGGEQAQGHSFTLIRTDKRDEGHTWFKYTEEEQVIGHRKEHLGTRKTITRGQS